MIKEKKFEEILIVLGLSQEEVEVVKLLLMKINYGLRGIFLDFIHLVDTEGL